MSSGKTAGRHQLFTMSNNAPSVPRRPVRRHECIEHIMNKQDEPARQGAP